LLNDPDEEKETVRAKLKEHGVDVEKYERNNALSLLGLTDVYLSNGKLNRDIAVNDTLNWWTETKRKGYKHIRDIEDLGNFSFVNGQWQKFITECWLDPRWGDPNVSEWVKSKESVGVVYDPFIIEVTAINVEYMTEMQVTEILKTFGRGSLVPARLIDLLEDVNSFSRSIGLTHEQFVGSKIVLEVDPDSDYEKFVDSLARENMANVEPVFVFALNASPLHKYLVNQSAIKFFLTSLSTSTPKSISENKVLLPAKNTPLILEAINKVLETYVDANVCFVFDILSDLLTTIGREKNFIFLRHALDLLSSKKTTSLFLLNTSAHEPKVVSRIRELLPNQLIYDRVGLKIIKTF
jgi:hypothetical protein